MGSNFGYMRRMFTLLEKSVDSHLYLEYTVLQQQRTLVRWNGRGFGTGGGGFGNCLRFGIKDHRVRLPAPPYPHQEQ